MKKLICPDLPLGSSLRQEQIDFFKEHGAIVFRHVLLKDQVELIISEIERIEKKWVAEGRQKINGIPLKFGKDEMGNTVIQRGCFLSLYSDTLHQLMQDCRMKALTSLMTTHEGRISETE